MMAGLLLMIVSGVTELVRTVYTKSVMAGHNVRAVLTGGLTTLLCYVLVLECIESWSTVPWIIVGDMVGTYLALTLWGRPITPVCPIPSVGSSLSRCPPCRENPPIRHDDGPTNW